MSSLRPTSVSDTTPLQHLENLSNSSESSTPTLNVNCASGVDESVEDRKGCFGAPAALTLVTAKGTSPAAATLPNSASQKHSNQIETHFNNFVSVDKKRGMDYRQETRKIFSRIALDFVILGCVSLPILVFHIWGEAYKRGFFCDDASLKHPYRSSTVPSWMLYLMGFVVPIAVITTVEFFISNNNRMRGFGNLSTERYYLCHLEIADWIIELYNKVGVLIFGAGIGQLTTDIAKYSIGRLRPHFFAVCKPIMPDGSTCDDAINAGCYIEEFTCRSVDATPRMLKEIRLSFPSGHANFACFTMIYMAIYLQTRMTWQRCKMCKHLLQFLFLMFAWYTALTRVSDYQHHWTDVLAGSVIGALYAIVLTLSMW